MEKVTSKPQSLQSTAIKLEYDIEDRPPLRRLLLLGIQWFAIGVPSLIVIGKIVAGLHYTNPLDMVVYLQKLTFITGTALLTQILFGHRLPLILGPSTVLTIGVIAGKDFGEHVIYSAILLGGILLFLCSITGLFGKLQKLFTPRIVAVVLLLIAFTLLPSVLNLINGHGTGIPASHNIAFGLAFAFSLFLFQRFLKGIWQLTILLWGMLGGSLIYSSFLLPYASGWTGGALQCLFSLLQGYHHTSGIQSWNCHIFHTLFRSPFHQRSRLHLLHEGYSGGRRHGETGKSWNHHNGSR